MYKASVPPCQSGWKQHANEILHLLRSAADLGAVAGGHDKLGSADLC